MVGGWKVIHFGLEIIHKALESIRVIWDKFATTFSRQKSYACKVLEFYVGDKIYLKISPMKGVMRFGRKGKLSPRYVGPFKILQRVGEVAYKLALPTELASVHPVFHFSNLRKYLGIYHRIFMLKVCGLMKTCPMRKFLLRF